MKLNKRRNTVDERPLDRDAIDVGKDADLKNFEASSAHYDRRSRIRRKWHQGDFWISIGLYLVLLSVAFVVF